MNPNHFQKLLHVGHGLLIFLILARIWLSEMCQIWGFRAFWRKCLERMAWNLAWLMYPDHLETDYFHVMISWFSSFWCKFDIVRPSKFEGSSHSELNIWREWPEIWHADPSWPPWELIRFRPWSVDFPNFCCIRYVVPCLSHRPLVAKECCSY